MKFCHCTESRDGFPNRYLSLMVLILSGIFSLKSHGDSYIYSGTYTDSIIASDACDSAILSGSITMNYAQKKDPGSALYANYEGLISGTVDDLTINLLGPAQVGIRTHAGGAATLTGPVTINGHSDQSEGMSSLSDTHIRINGPVQINQTGNFTWGVNALPGRITIDGPLSVKATGAGAQGIYVGNAECEQGVVTLNGKTDIQVTGREATAIGGNNGTVYIHNAMSITASDDAFAIQTKGSGQWNNKPLLTRASASSDPAVMAVTTREDAYSQQPSPQVININGKISLKGENNLLVMDLNGRSHINSQLACVGNNSKIRLHFHKPDARWTTAPGSTIGNGGSMILDFVNGGVWELPLAEANRVDKRNSAPVAPLTIARDGHFSFDGYPLLLGNVQSSLDEGEKATFLLVKKDITNSPLSLDLDRIIPVTDKQEYMLSLEQGNEGSEEYLYGILSPNPGATIVSLDINPADPTGSKIAPVSNVPSRSLPIESIDQTLASYLLSTRPDNDICQLYPESMTGGGLPYRCADLTDAGTYLWVLPFYEHLKANDLDIDADHVGYRANIRGVALGLTQPFDAGRWSLGVFGGNSDSRSRGDRKQTSSHADFMGGMLYGAASTDPVVVTAGLLYLRSEHRLSNELNRKSDGDIDIWGGQVGLGMPVSFEGWAIIPSVGLEYWHTRLQHGRVTNKENGKQEHSYQSSAQTYWQLPASLAFRRQSSLSSDAGNVMVIPEMRVRFIPSWGDRDLSVTAWDHDLSAAKYSLAGARRDSYRTEADLGMHIAGGSISSTWRYAVGKSKNTLSQQVSGEIIWAF